MILFSITHKKLSFKGYKFPLLFLLMGIFFTSCFTGIESTKKINLSREDKRNLIPTKEEKYMAKVEAVPLKEWEEGKRFIASDDRALLVIIPQSGILPYGPDSIKGKELLFKGIESKINAAGNLTVALLFTDGTYLYAYDTGKEFDIAMEEMKSDQIPMLIDEEMVTKAKNLLTGQKVWCISNLWYDKDGNRIEGRKYIEVTIRDVKPGNMIFPLNVEIETDDNQSAFMFMNFGSENNESRAFHNLFSLSDIRKHYPNIEPETWNYISQGKVKEGMTKDEVRLSLGNPKDLNSGHDYSQTLDIWSYENGRVLWFEDGRLVKIRQ